jgi:hypothetical protein
VSAFKDTDYENAVYQRLLVVVNSIDLEKRFYFETQMSTVFGDTGIFAEEGYKLFPPTRVLSDTEKIELLKRDSIDGYISIDVGESGVAQMYIPPTRTRTSDGRTTKTVTTGGYVISKPWSEFYAKLIDASTGRTVWTSSAFTGGNAFANSHTIINSFCDKILSQLVADHLIITNSQRESERRHLDLSNLVADSSDRQYLYPISMRKTVRLYVNGTTSDGYLVGETPDKYLVLSNKEARDRIQYIPKRIVQKVEDVQ